MSFQPERPKLALVPLRPFTRKLPMIVTVANVVKLVHSSVDVARFQPV